MSASLSIAEAVEMLKIDRPDAARWLRRYIQRREEATGAQVLVDISAGGARPTYRIQVAKLRSLCPELFGSEVRVSQALQREGRANRKALERIVDSVDDLRVDVAGIRELLRKRHG